MSINNTADNLRETCSIDHNKKVIFITGASRGVGLSIAKSFAQNGDYISIIAKTVEAHPKLPGTIYTAEAEIKAAGASDVIINACDARNLEGLKAAIDATIAKFGRIDIVVNNASALYLLNTENISESKFDLMYQVIVRASMFTVKYALPGLIKSANAHVINLSPPIDFASKWFKDHTVYTMCKYSLSMLTIGLSADLAGQKIAVNSLWPSSLLATSAVQNLLGGDCAMQQSRDPRIIADAVKLITNKDSSVCTGNHFLDSQLLRDHGVNIDQYAISKDNALGLLPDIYVEYNML